MTKYLGTEAQPSIRIKLTNPPTRSPLKSRRGYYLLCIFFYTFYLTHSDWFAVNKEENPQILSTIQLLSAPGENTFATNDSLFSQRMR